MQLSLVSKKDVALVQSCVLLKNISKYSETADQKLLRMVLVSESSSLKLCKYFYLMETLHNSCLMLHFH